MQLIVLGMHRSGTSVVARSLNMMGAYYAPEGISTGANLQNPKGFWERRDVRNLNDMLLHSAGCDWHKVSKFTLAKIPPDVLEIFEIRARTIIMNMDSHRPWFMKEPRFCLLLPLWLKLFELPVVVFTSREPVEVAKSLETRNQLPLAHGIALWEYYNLQALTHSLDTPRVFVRHDRFLADPATEFARLHRGLEAFGVRGLTLPSEKEIKAFVDPSLFRSRPEEDLKRALLNIPQQRLALALESGSAAHWAQIPLLSEGASKYLASKEKNIQIQEGDDQMERHKRILENKNRRIREQTESLERYKKILDRRRKLLDQEALQISEPGDAVEKVDERLAEKTPEMLAGETRFQALRDEIMDETRMADLMLSNLKMVRQDLEEQRERFSTQEQARELQQLQAEQALKIALLEKKIGEQDLQNFTLERKLAEQNLKNAASEKKLAEQALKASVLEKKLAEQDLKNAASEKKLAEYALKTSTLEKKVSEQRASVNRLQASHERTQRENLLLNTAILKLKEIAKDVAGEVDRIRGSSRWRYGGYLLFRPGTEKGSLKKKVLLEYGNWFKQQKSTLGSSLPSTAPSSDTAHIKPLAQNSVTPELMPEGIVTAPIKPSTQISIPSLPSKPRVAVEGRQQLRKCVSIVPTVAVPIYNAFPEVSDCLSSLIRCKGAAPHQILLLDDCSPDERIWPLLQQFASLHPHVTAFRNEKNLGYTATVNTACRWAKGDIILLNSDTIVTEGWIEKLSACAKSLPNVATVTAVSNAAGAFSVPENNKVNPISEELGIQGIGRLVEMESRRIRPPTPTGNGFCLYITRDALNKTGLFDVENFPHGYGEENDFCMRASAQGYVHLVDDSTYIAHARTASFGEKKDAILEESKKKLAVLHPTYKPLVTEWLKEDPLASWRTELKNVMNNPVKGGPDARDSRKCVLYLIHNGAGGTILTSEDLSGALRANYRCMTLRAGLQDWMLFEQVEDSLVLIRHYTFTNSWNWLVPMDQERVEVLQDILKHFEVSLAHVRHLLATGAAAIQTIREKGVPIIFSLHDFYTICPTIQLLDENGVYCAGKCTPTEGDCPISRKWFHGGRPPLKHAYVFKHQEIIGPALCTSDRLITTSEYSRDVILSIFPRIPPEKFVVIEHGRDFPADTAVKAPIPGAPLKVVIFGVLGRSKGLSMIDELVDLNVEAGLPLEIHFLGILGDQFNAARPGVIDHGSYDRSEISKRLCEIGPAVAIIASIWPETYCHTLSEAWACGIPVVASNLGTLRERVTSHGGGWLVEPGNAAAWFEQLQKIRADLSEYQRMLDSIAGIKIRSTHEMAADYTSIYEELLTISPKEPVAVNTKPLRLEQTLDVVIPVHNALDDVKRCLSSVAKNHDSRILRVILVNDGSDVVTRDYLRKFSQRTFSEVILIENTEAMGYTKAANQGLLSSKSDYAVLLNSDTIVPEGWADGILRCGESDPAIGIVSPMSNAASWQSLPRRFYPGKHWAVNDLPGELTLEKAALTFGNRHDASYPQVPLANGFCFAIKRQVMRKIGILDEVSFPKGYGEENDFCMRASDAGYRLAIADDVYVFHAKSKSYSHDSRLKLSGQSGLILKKIYGKNRIAAAVEILRHSPGLLRAREHFKELFREPPPMAILFLLGFRGSGGGVHSIIQEAMGLWQLGLQVQVAIRQEDAQFYLQQYPSVPDTLFYVFESKKRLARRSEVFDICVATLFTSVKLLAEILATGSPVKPSYYIQDYEPLFFDPSEPWHKQAMESYTLIPEMQCFAKTQWICDIVQKNHGVLVNKVRPSIDREVYFPDESEKPGSPFVITAMVRPKTERRSPQLTFDVLRKIKLTFGDQVEIEIFGVEADDPFFDAQPKDFTYAVQGVLQRQEVASLLRKSSLFIDASSYQAFGRTGLEAMACRCATILPADCGTSEYAVDGVNTVLVAPTSVEVVFAAALRYLNDKEFTRSVITEGLKTAGGYSVEDACRSELAFFESLRKPVNRQLEKAA